MSYVGCRGNSTNIYRSSEQNAIIHKNMHHLRDNSGDRSFDNVDLTIKHKVDPKKKRTQSTAEQIMKSRFPMLASYHEPSKQQNLEEESIGDGSEEASIQMKKVERYGASDYIDEEGASWKERGNNSDTENEEKRITIK